MRRRRGLVAGCLAVVSALAAPAAAVPIPWKNCGAPGDALSIALASASVWPPSVPAPAHAVATFDEAGNLVNLRLFLLHGVAWTFDSGPLPTTTSGGFVALPASFPVTVASPALPLPAGPYFTTHTFAARTSQPVTIVEHANLAAPLDGPLAVSVGLSLDGTPGFLLTNAVPTAYTVHVQMTQPGGAGVFCLDLTEPVKTIAPFVSIEAPPRIPALSRVAVMALSAMLCAIGLCAIGTRWRRRRRFPS